jgi:putative transposase
MSEQVLCPSETVRPVRSRAAIRQRWIERLDRFAASGQTTAEFCASEGISVASFYLWKRRLAGKEPNVSPQDAGPRLLPVRLHDQPSAIELVLPGGALVRVWAGADETALRCLLALLGVQPC